MPSSGPQSVANVRAPVRAQPEQFKALTSLRFVAATMIVVTHSRGSFGNAADLGAPFDLTLGVSFFFMLSGFVLTHVYPSLEGPGSRRFLVARLARLWPAHLATFALLFLLLPEALRSTTRGYTLPAALSNIFMLHAWIPFIESYFSFNAVSWSISTELGLYLLFPLLIHNFRRTWHTKYALALVVAAVLGGLTTSLGLTKQKYGELLPDAGGMVIANPLVNLHLFVLGMATWLAWQRLAPRFSVGIGIATMLEAGALVLSALAVYSSLAVGERVESVAPWLWATGQFDRLPISLPPLSFAALILTMALGRGLVSRILSLAPCVFLGEISFGVYLLHLVLLRWYWNTLNWEDLAAIPHPVQYGLFWLATLTGAWLLRWSIERPARALIRAWWQCHEPSLSPARWRVIGGVVAAATAAILGVQVVTLSSAP